MKVLSEGKKWTEEVECKECKAKLEIEESDLKVINTAVAYAGETWDPEIVVNCGVCGSTVYVGKKVPSGLKSRLETAARNARRK